MLETKPQRHHRRCLPKKSFNSPKISFDRITVSPGACDGLNQAIFNKKYHYYTTKLLYYYTLYSTILQFMISTCFLCYISKIIFDSKFSLVKLSSFANNFEIIVVLNLFFFTKFVFSTICMMPRFLKNYIAF